MPSCIWLLEVSLINLDFYCIATHCHTQTLCTHSCHAKHACSCMMLMVRHSLVVRHATITFRFPLHCNTPHTPHTHTKTQITQTHNLCTQACLLFGTLINAKKIEIVYIEMHANITGWPACLNLFKHSVAGLNHFKSKLNLNFKSKTFKFQIQNLLLKINEPAFSNPCCQALLVGCFSWHLHGIFESY